MKNLAANYLLASSRARVNRSSTQMEHLFHVGIQYYIPASNIIYRHLIFDICTAYIIRYLYNLNSRLNHPILYTSAKTGCRMAYNIRCIHSFNFSNTKCFSSSVFLIFPYWIFHILTTGSHFPSKLFDLSLGPFLTRFQFRRVFIFCSDQTGE